MDDERSKNLPGREHPPEGNQFDRFFGEVNAWLSDDKAPPTKLSRWLQGIGGPAQAYGGELGEWLYRALTGPDRLNLRDRMAERLSRLLDEQPDSTPPEGCTLPEDLLENLFNLAALLEDKQRLGAALLEVFFRHEKGNGPLMQDLRVRTAFRSALAHNQSDHRLRDVWFGLIRHHQVPPIAGDEFAGLEGLLLMPLGAPQLDDVYVGLSAFAGAVAADRTKRRVFSRALERFDSVLPGQNFSGIHFVDMARQHQIPTWAVECSPTLFEQLDLEGDPSGNVRFLLWKRLASLVLETNPNAIRVEQPQPSGDLIELISVPISDAGQVVDWARQIEAFRKTACYSGVSDHEFECWFYHWMTETTAAFRQASARDKAGQLERLEQQQKKATQAITLSPRSARPPTS